MASQGQLALRFLAVISAFVLALVWWLVPRAPLESLVVLPGFLIDLALLLALILLSFKTALRLSLPGLTRGSLELTALLFLAGVLCFRLYRGSAGLVDAYPHDHPDYLCATPVFSRHCSGLVGFCLLEGVSC